MMDPILAPLLNFGGLGAALAVLFWLFREQQIAFRQDLEAERNLRHDDHQQLLQSLDSLSTEMRDLSETIRMLRRETTGTRSPHSSADGAQPGGGNRP